MLRRLLRLPARRNGGGIRCRLELAPAAYNCASLVESMERYLPADGRLHGLLGGARAGLRRRRLRRGRAPAGAVAG